MNTNNLFWTVIFLTISGVAGWNIYQNRQLKMRVPVVENTMEKTLYSQKKYELSYSGRVIKWPEGMEVLGSEFAREDQDDYEGYQLALVISELSCDVCRDEQTQFALQLAAETDPRMLKIVVNSQKLYARGFMRLNSVQQPIFFDPENRFFDANRIGSTPLLLLLSPQNEVIAAHYPIPDHPEASKPFHEFCRFFLGLDKPGWSS